MVNWKLQNFQENKNLRIATLFIALLSLVFEFTWLILSSLMAWALVDRSSLDKHPGGYVYLLRFLLFVFMLIICFEIVLCISLLIGWFKRLPDHLQMWYMGFLLCLTVRTPVAIFVTKHEFYDYNRKWFGVIITEIVIETLVTLCFIYVVRSYYMRMSTETNYYQNLSYAQANKQVQAFYNDKKSDKPKKVPKKVAFENDIDDYNDMDMRPPQYGQLDKGDQVYPVQSAPEPPLVEIHEKQDSTIYPSLA